MNEDLMEFVTLTVIVTIVVCFFVLLTLGAVAGITYVVQRNYCSHMQTLAPEYEFDMNLWSGCMVKTQSGYWTSAQEYFKRLEIVHPESVK